MQAVLTLGGIAFDGGANITRSGHGWGLQAITDWHSLTASKAQINERPQAHGAFDPGTDWRKSTANEIKAAYWGHDHNDLIRAIQQLTALANRDELMECTMDVDGVVLRRMVSVRNVDVPDTRGRSNLQGIVVDLLAPDPRAYGVVSSDSTGLPVHGGGLVFDTSPSTRWTGTPNASTSTLSQDGTVVATNLAPNAKPVSSGFAGFNFNDFSHGVPVLSDTAQGMLIDGTGMSDKNIGARIIQFAILGPGDYHLHGRVRTEGSWDIDFALAYYPYANIQPSSLVDGVADMDFHVDSPVKGELHLKCPAGSTAEWDNIGLYTAADWQAMQARGVTWFDGDSYPGHLLFPVGFGSPGSDGRARFVNTGTAPASVTMTVMGGGSEGITLKRVENGAVLTLSRP